MTAVPRVRIQDLMGVFTPDSLRDLHGPSEGVLSLPKHLFWGPHNSAPLTDQDHLAELYQAVVRTGSAEDQREYLDAAILRRLWSELMLPAATRAVWEGKFPELMS